VIDGEEAGRGVGRTKKDAEQAAAREALEKQPALSDEAA
jgi:dsRNA-specific ribonuclease